MIPGKSKYMGASIQNRGDGRFENIWDGGKH